MGGKAFFVRQGIRQSASGIRHPIFRRFIPEDKSVESSTKLSWISVTTFSFSGLPFTE
jgi:hypothetical protein